MTHHRVGPKGQVVVPKRIRDRLGIRPGDEVTFEEGVDEVRIRRVRPPATLRGALGPSAVDPLEVLEREHRLEREREDNG